MKKCGAIFPTSNLYMPHLDANKRNKIQEVIIVFLPHQDGFVD
jgi:hypothetical protein